MAQTGIDAPFRGQVGKIHTDHAPGNGYKCDAGGCANPCNHCSAGCKGQLYWSAQDLDEGRIVYCSATARHPYKVVLSG